MVNDSSTVAIEDDLGEDQEASVTFRYSISAYGADYPVDGLVQRLETGDIDVPVFQRGFVWNFGQASRFIESLLLGLPVPGIFLSREPDTQKLLVIDGQQRLRTLQFFYSGVFEATGREFALKGVQREFEGATYKTLRDEDRRRLNDSILHATIVRQDEPSDDESSIYYIFERLNTGGTQLAPQEIRTALYAGDFSHVLETLNSNESWRAIFGPINRRKRDEELILRFLSLYFYGGNYARPMKEFLNSYMGKNRHLEINTAEEMKRIFTNTIDTVYECLGSKAFKPVRALNAAIFDAVMVALATRLESGPITDCNAFQTRYRELLNDDAFIFAIGRATADEESVRNRIALATRTFTAVP